MIISVDFAFVGLASIALFGPRTSSGTSQRFSSLYKSSGNRETPSYGHLGPTRSPPFVPDFLVSAFEGCCHIAFCWQPVSPDEACSAAYCD
ncbi:hypothetical protein GE09DRAFT_1089295 [Coniochaeta sp. 2T2.1]|nr:hypothetical protein GE09DRAFT_1089295 [Coniochaeta sp. 2T2.1]